LTKSEVVVSLIRILRNRNNMKKLFALLAVAGMFFTAACGTQEVETEDNVEIVDETVEVEAEEAEMDAEEVEVETEEETEETAA
jgi:hypothetical protein